MPIVDLTQEQFDEINENGPKSIAEFGSWCRWVYRVLSVGVAIDNYGDADEQTLTGTAYWVQQAGEFALDFMATELFKACPAVQGMSPRDGILVIDKCLSWCIAQESQESAAIRSDDGVATNRNSPKPSEEAAYRAFQHAQRQTANNLTDQQAWKWLFENDFDGYQPPRSAATFATYVRKGRLKYEGRRNSPRGGRTDGTGIRSQRDQ